MIKIGFLSPALLIAVTTIGICQLFKFITGSLSNKKLDFSQFVSAGGMPSSHSAFVTSLSISIGYIQGFNSEIFALSFVFAAIIVFDSFNLRGTVETHSKLFKKLEHLLPEKSKIHTPHKTGHSIPEILAGVLVGSIIAIILNLFIIKV